MKKLGAMMAGGGGSSGGGASGGGRAPDDFYPTPRAATLALIEAERDAVDSLALIWEPAAGDGAMADEFAACGANVWSSDVRPKRDDIFQFDFCTQCGCDLPRTAYLNLRRHGHKAGIVTNPPFKHAERFIRVALDDLGTDYAAFLLKATYWHAAARLALFRQHPPARIIALTWRLDFLGLGAPAMDCVWCVWRGGWRGPTEYSAVSRPAEGGELFDG